MNIAIVSGGFDPLHIGHLNLIKSARKHGQVHVLLNSDDWLTRKKGKPFMCYEDRMEILISLEQVWGVHPVDDYDGTVTKGIMNIAEWHPDSKITFVNGGDRGENNTPEASYCEEHGIECIYNAGGEKIVTSSDLMGIEKKPWGSQQTLSETRSTKTRILNIDPMKRISLQYHRHRNEQWMVTSGFGSLELEGKSYRISTGDVVDISTYQKHRVLAGDDGLTIFELQLGVCDDEDIVRLEDDHGRC